MTVDFSKLSQESKREIERIQNIQHTESIQFVRDRFEVIDEYLISQLQLQRAYADAQDGSGAGQGRREKNLFKQLQVVKRYQEKIYSTDVPLELYYLLYDFEADLSRDECYVIAAGTNVRKIRLANIFMTREFLTSYAEVDELDLGGLESDPHLITIPRNELLNPFSYTLIAHELFHDHNDCISNLKGHLDYLGESVPESEKEELCVDAMSLNYLGPAYAPALVDLHDKIDEKSIESYPDIGVRIAYLIDYLEFAKEKVDDNPVYTKVVTDVIQELYKKREVDDIDYRISKFEDFNQRVVKQLNDHNIPTFLQRYNDLHSQIGVENKKSLTEVIDVLLETDDSDGTSRPVAIPIKPVLLFNLLLLLDERETEELQIAVLSSLRKWYARNKFTAK